MTDTLYLNNAATSWPKPEAVYQAVDRFNRHIGSNPGRGSRTLEAGGVLLDTREALARLFNFTDLSRLAFTKNVTESINIALKGYLNPGDHLITSSMEHNAMARPIHTLEKQGVEVSVLSCAPDGSLEPDQVAAAWRPNTRMVAMLHASNLTGTILPAGEIGRLVRERGGVFLLDAAQTAGVLPIDVHAMAIDILAFTGHKGLLGPQGTGGLYVRPGVELRPLIEGGTGSRSDQVEQPDFMPDKLESGTPNTPGIAGLGAGVEFILQTGVAEIRRHEQRLTDLLIEGLRRIKGITIYGPGDSQLQTGVVSVNLAGVESGELSYYLDQHYGIVTRSGLHCAPWAHRTIGTLASGTCRFSPGYFNTAAEIERTVAAVAEIAATSSTYR